MSGMLPYINHRLHMVGSVIYSAKNIETHSSDSVLE